SRFPTFACGSSSCGRWTARSGWSCETRSGRPRPWHRLEPRRGPRGQAADEVGGGNSLPEQKADGDRRAVAGRALHDQAPVARELVEPLLESCERQVDTALDPSLPPLAL